MKRRHVWHPASKTKAGKPLPSYCERCGQDRTPAVEKAACRPTGIF